MPGRWRHLAWNLPVAIIAAVAIAAAAEAWHAAWNSCAVLVGFGGLRLLSCSHPGGFGMEVGVFVLPHFLVLLWASLTILVPLWLSWEVLAWRFQTRMASVGGNGRGGLRRCLGSPEVVGIAVPGLAFAASFLAVGLVPLGRQADLGDPWWGMRLVILLTIPAVGAVFALLVTARLSILAAGSPVIVAAGVYAGALFGYLPTGNIALAPLLAPPFAYAAYLFSYIAHPKNSLSGWAAAFHTTVTSLMFVPLAALHPLTLWFRPFVGIYVGLVAAVSLALWFWGEGRERTPQAIY